MKKLKLLKKLEEEVQASDEEKELKKLARKALSAGHFDSVGVKKDGSFVVKRHYFYRVQAGKSPDAMAKTVEAVLKKANLKAHDMEAHDHWAPWPKESYFWVKFKVKRAEPAEKSEEQK